MSKQWNATNAQVLGVSRPRVTVEFRSDSPCDVSLADEAWEEARRQFADSDEAQRVIALQAIWEELAQHIAASQEGLKEASGSLAQAATLDDVDAGMKQLREHSWNAENCQWEARLVQEELGRARNAAVDRYRKLVSDTMSKLAAHAEEMRQKALADIASHTGEALSLLASAAAIHAKGKFAGFRVEDVLGDEPAPIDTEKQRNSVPERNRHWFVGAMRPSAVGTF